MTLTRLLRMLTMLFMANTFFSCEEQREALPEISIEEVHEIITASFDGETGGFTQQLNAMIDEITLKEVLESCNETVNEIITYEHDNGMGTTVSYEAGLSFQLTCGPLSVPETATFDLISQNSYATPVLSSDDNSVLMGSIMGFSPLTEPFVISGRYERIGSQLFVENNQVVDSELTIVMSDLTISKEPLAITGGVGELIFSGTYEGSDFLYEGSITFEGDGVILVNLGEETFEITLGL